MITSINHSILMLVFKSLKNGNIRQCEALGFSYDELNAINQLTLDELFCLSRAGSHFMSVTIQHDILRKMLAQAKQEIIIENRITRAVALGGSIELLSHFFGLSSSEISARRRLMGVLVPQGRTQIPGEKDDAKIWQLWQQYRPGNIDSLGMLDSMIKIVEEMAQNGSVISLTVVWNRIQLWEKEQGSCQDG